jgi:leucyl aminopeptidase
MDFELKPLTLAQAAAAEADALVLAWPDHLPDALPQNLTGPWASGAENLLAWLHPLLKSGELEVGVGKQLVVLACPAVVARRLVLVRVGDGSAPSVRKGLLAAFAGLKQAAVKHAVVFLGLPGVNEAAVRAAVVATADATYRYTTTHSKPKSRQLDRVTVAMPHSERAQRLVAEGQALVNGIELAKEWANRPANHATPTLLAQAAEKLGKHPRVKVDVLGPKEVAKLGMGAFMAVAQGSSEPLRFVVIRYQGGAKEQPPVVLVGKGITFDTGGISIKPAAEMDEMKFDMGGAASVLGTLQAVAELQPAINVVGIIPSCENMPDGRAVKPGDVVTSMSGQTIEILNTDAEGRLILCDALTYAARLNPASVIDVATLTGACVVALGAVRTGLFSADDALATKLSSAGEQAQDLCWRMPLDDEYAEGLKSNFADMGNVAGRSGGAISAAKFLQKFTANLRWAHLDIAGTAWKSGAAKGATGRPVSLLVQYVLNEAALLQAVPAGAGKAEKAPKPKKSAG